jgi:predicted nucleotidyltransferase
VRTVAGRLGHANPAMTLHVYAHTVTAADEALAVALGDVLDRAANPVRHDEVGVGQSRGMDVLARFGADRQAVAEFCRRNGIRQLAVFGSALRDDFTPESDVDLLVEFEPGQKVSLFDMACMEMELEEIIRDHRVDLRTVGDLSRRFRDRVVAEAEAVYDAAA